MIEREIHKKTANLREYFAEYNDVILAIILISIALLLITVILRIIYPNQENYMISEELRLRESFLMMFLFVWFTLYTSVIQPVMAIMGLSKVKKTAINVLSYVIMGILVFFRNFFDSIFLHLFTLNLIFMINLIITISITVFHTGFYLYYR